MEKVTHAIGRSSGPLLLGLTATFVIAQVLVRPAVGIANNGDFSKMAGTLGLGPEDGDWLSHQHYGEINSRSERADSYIYTHGIRRADSFWSSEFFL